MEAVASQMESLEPKIVAFGRDIFSAIGQEQPTTFNKAYWSGRIMEWSMTRPDFKVNMFRLVDVLPTLTSSAAVASHVTEYLSEPARNISGLMAFGVNIPPHSLRAKIATYVVRKSVAQMAALFIAGESPRAALPRLRELRRKGLCYTVDLLGEFCLSESEAKSYFERYLEALDVFGASMPSWPEGAPLVAGHPGEQSPICISVKLTALYSQCSALNFERSVRILSERLGEIARRARRVGALMYVDAEDSGNNSIVYETFKRVFGSAEFKDFPYPGIVVQAYSKASAAVIDDLLAFSKQRGSPIAIRLVKGAYWDYERIVCEQNDWPCPLFQKKESTDANYERLTRTLIDHHQLVLPAFASHNVRSLSHACCYAEASGLSPAQFELQMLYGMAQPIAQAFSKRGYLVRLYVPLGAMLPGMGYLVRRLLENTSNESFLRHAFFEADEVAALLREPHFQE